MRNRALKFAVGFAILGLILTILVAYIERGALRTYHEKLPYLTLANKTKNQATKAHIWLEELIAGDASLNFDRDVQSTLQSALSLLQQAYDGKLNDGLETDEDARAILKEVIFDFERLAGVADERWKTKLETTVVAMDSTAEMVTSHAGDELDQQFDASYETSQLSLERFENHVTQTMNLESSYLSVLSWVSIAFLAAAFAVLCFFLFSVLQKSGKMVMEHESRLAQQQQAVTTISTFIDAISAGNYEAELSLEQGAEAGLGNTLVTMRDKLRISADGDRKRNWSTSGLAQIGEILRTSTGSSEELFDNILKFVVKYTRSNQGGLFVLNEENESDKHLDLVACYAFERKKYIAKKIAIGEGLVGQCFLEGERIYLMEVPAEYVSITSGLGGASPNALLLVPLRNNDKIFGVLELATFTKYDSHEIELVEKLTESIASTISSVRVSESTRILLEKSQQQAEEMGAQEEEMRQNMEELEATQEEMRRKEKHIQNMLDGEKQRNEISQKNRQVIMELTKNKDVQEGNWNASLEKITSCIARQLGITRSSIWEYKGKENKISCEKLFQSDRGTFESGTEIYGRDFPGYFEAVTREEVIVAKDATTHPATNEFAEVYLRPLGIRSMLDVPFFNEGKIAGIICCEHQHVQKDWTDEDIEFLKSCADLITVTYNTSKINKMLSQLSDDQETMQTIIDNIPRAVFWKDKELRFQGCNRIFANVAGLKSHKDLLGKTDYEMPWKEHGDAYRTDDMTVMNSRKARLDLEERNVNSEGVESWVLISKVPVMNKHGEVVAVLGMFEDITERKRKESEMLQNLEELKELRKKVEKMNK